MSLQNPYLSSTREELIHDQWTVTFAGILLTEAKPWLKASNMKKSMHLFKYVDPLIFYDLDHLIF